MSWTAVTQTVPCVVNLPHDEGASNNVMPRSPAVTLGRIASIYSVTCSSWQVVPQQQCTSAVWALATGDQPSRLALNSVSGVMYMPPFLMPAPFRCTLPFFVQIRKEPGVAAW